MTNIQPNGELMRKAVKHISEERKYNPGRKLQQLLDEAAMKFNLSPMQVEYLANFLRKSYE